jgi:DNA primase
VLTKHEDWPVIVVEGEKDVATLEEVFAGQSVCITTNSGGAKKWPITHGGILAGRRVTIFPDNDCVGMEHACMVAASALIYQCESVRVIRWDSKVPEGADVTDWLMEHHAKSTAAQKRSAIIGLIKAAEREEYKRKGLAA